MQPAGAAVCDSTTLAASRAPRLRAWVLPAMKHTWLHSRPYPRQLHIYEADGRLETTLPPAAEADEATRVSVTDGLDDAAAAEEPSGCDGVTNRWRLRDVLDVHVADSCVWLVLPGSVLPRPKPRTRLQVQLASSEEAQELARVLKLGSRVIA